MMLGTLSFLATTPEAWQEGQGVPQLSMQGEALLKDGVLLGACLLTAADSLRAGHAPVVGRRAVAPATGYNTPAMMLSRVRAAVPALPPTPSGGFGVIRGMAAGNLVM
jgi:hypothetical protein